MFIKNSDEERRNLNRVIHNFENHRARLEHLCYREFAKTLDHQLDFIEYRERFTIWLKDAKVTDEIKDQIKQYEEARMYALKESNRYYKSLRLNTDEEM